MNGLRKFSALWLVLVGICLVRPCLVRGESNAFIEEAEEANIHVSDRSGPRFADLIALNLGLLSFVLLFIAGRHIAGLIAGILLLDRATQANIVSNQTRIYSLLQTQPTA